MTAFYSVLLKNNLIPGLVQVETGSSWNCVHWFWSKTFGAILGPVLIWACFGFHFSPRIWVLFGPDMLRAWYGMGLFWIIQSVSDQDWFRCDFGFLNNEVAILLFQTGKFGTGLIWVSF